jgi:putative transposase
MAYRRTPFAPQEWYHCYNRGIDGRPLFIAPEDTQRFIELLYLCNSTTRFERGNFQDLAHDEVLALERGEPLVAIGAYCLMDNHWHLLLQEIVEGGISKFLQRVGTGYTVFFNKKYEHVGNVMVKPFRSKHVSNDRYLRRVVQYIHFNPAEIYEPNWKKGRVKNFKSLQKKLLAYEGSSLMDYHGSKRVQRAILDPAAVGFLGDGLPRLSDVLLDAAAYYKETQAAFLPKT